MSRIIVARQIPDLPAHLFPDDNIAKNNQQMKNQSPPLPDYLKLAIFTLIALLSACCRMEEIENQDPVTTEQLAEGFVNPPDSVKPWVYWYWISDNSSRDGITKDLEAMAEAGIGEAMIGNIGNDGMPYGKVSILSEEWWQHLEHAIREGKRLGVNIGLFNCPGWSQSGGPWVESTEAMRYLVYSELEVEGNKRITVRPERPGIIFQDIRTIAFPLPENENMYLSHFNPKINVSPALDFPERLSDGDTGSVCLFTRAGRSETITIDLNAEGPFTARSMTLHSAGIPFAADVDLQVIEGDSCRSIKSFRYDRSNPAVNVGPIRFGPVTVSFPEVTALHFRIVMSNFSLSNYLTNRPDRASDAGLSEIEISSAPRLEAFIEKQLGKMCQTPFPSWSAYQWEKQEESGTTAMKIDPLKVIDLSSNLSDDGTLTWDAPEGRWLIMRFGASPTGALNAVSPPHATGWEVDKMNRQHLENHFNAYIGKLLARMPAEDRSSLKHVVLDSYEQGSQNWTDDLVEDFKTRYGYDPIPWLPVLSGRIVASADQSERFLWDLRRIVADRIAYDYVGGFRDLCQENGLKIWLENYGHWGFPSEFLMYGGQSHDIAGEFWNEGDLGNIECRASSSAAHIYGKRKVSAESYTCAGMEYRRYPAMLKRRGDWSYTEGINNVVIHLYIHQPYEEKSPGINAWFGTEFNRKNTWFRQSKKWIDYQRRCMFMLQRGLPVNDVCFFIGEDVPIMTGTRIPELPRGYSFDYINAEVILNRLTVKDGRLVLPDGMSYKLMVLPPLEKMRPELLTRIKQLVAGGATILGAPPCTSPSLKNYPFADEEVKSLSKEMWDNTDDKTGSITKYGKGAIYNEADLQKVMNQIGILPDVSVPEEIPLLWIHRRLDDVDIYFITNQNSDPVTFEAAFRVSGRTPELWDAIDGMIRYLPSFRQDELTTTVPLKLYAGESAFIVFRKPGGAVSGKPADNFPEPETLVSITSPWEVSFDKAMRGPEDQVIMTSLADWTESSDNSIKYYSGPAVYRNSFVLDEIPPNAQVYAALGEVGVMAEVRINDCHAGGAWAAPWRCNVTNLVRKGKNTLEIEVVNSWVNRLIGDSMLPGEERKTWMNVNPVKPSDPLQQSGLSGPVSIISIRY